MPALLAPDGPALRLPAPHAGQRYVRHHARRFTHLRAGRRWRKTTLAMAIAAEAALRGEHVLWGAPTYDQVRVCWDEAYRAAATVARFIRSEMVADFPRTGGRLIFRSLDDPDHARGHSIHGAVLDETGDVKAAAWYEVILPMLMDSHGWGWCIGTPRGRNWWYTEQQLARERPDTIILHAPTLGAAIVDERLVRRPHPLENPSIDWAEIGKLFATMPRRTFLQEILAEFVEDGGGVFRGVRAAATATPQAARHVEYNRAGDEIAHTYVMGVDWAKHADWTVLSVIDATTRQQCALDRFHQIDYTLQLGRLRALHERFQCQIIVTERNAMGEPLIEQMQRDGLPVLPFLTTAASKASAIDALALAFERGDLRILADPTQLAELEAYEAQRLPSGTLRYSAPAGQHDDTVMALALAWSAVHQQVSYAPGLYGRE